MRNITSFILLFLGVLMGVSSSQGKAILLNEDAGLSNIEVTAIARDKSGMMWIATKRGLNKYDGYRFTSIPYFEKRTIHAILYDSTRDGIWVGSDIGLQLVDCKDNRVLQCTPLSRLNPVISLLQHHQDIIVGFQQQYVLQIGSDYRCKVLYRFSSEYLAKGKMVIDPKGKLYICLRPLNRMVNINRETGVATVTMERSNWLIELLAVFENDLYIGGVNRGYWNLNNRSASLWFLDSLNRIRQDPECILETNESILMAYRNDTRLYEVHKAEKKIVELSVKDKEVISNKRIYCLYRDDYGVIWVGTSKGLIKLIPDKPKPVFEQLLCNESVQVSTRQILEDEHGDLYIASYAGFFKFDKHTQRWRNWNKIQYLGSQNTFSQRSIVNAGSKYIYIGSDANYFVRLNKHTQQIETLFFQSPDGLCNTAGASLALGQDANGVIWIGSTEGLLSFDTSRSELRCHLTDKYGLNGATVKYIYMLPGKKQFWAGTEHGAFLIDIARGMLRHFDDNTIPALTGNNINAITTDRAGNIWLATDEGGINVLSADYREVYSITKKDGLSSNEVYHFLWQDSVRLWISTYNGLNYYHTQTKTIIPYYRSDGITDNEFNQNSALRAADGKMYFGGINGITAFYPPKMEVHQQPFSLFVSGISKWEKSSGLFKDICPNSDHEIILDPGDNLLTFAFAGTDYTHPELNTYFYKIEGLHNDWISLGAQPFLRLESLKAGTYTLFIKAIKGSRGVSSVNTLTYKLVVKQVFYQTFWFYLLLVGGLAFLIYFYFSNRLKTQKKLELLRVQIASNLHDDVGSLLTRITMSADRLITRMPRESETREKLEGVSQLSRAANVAMSDVLWTIDARNDITGSLTDRMREHAEDLLLPRGIDVSIDFAEVDQLQKLTPEFRQHVFLLYKEIINNIIKHSEATVVYISYHQSGEHCVLEVKNDGVHSPEGAVSTGQGLRNIKMRAEMLKGRAEMARDKDCFKVTVII